jgi:hypothetical protein
MAIYLVDTDGVSGDYSGLEGAVAALPNPLTEDYTIQLQASTSVPDVLSADLNLGVDTETFTIEIVQIDENYELQCPAGIELQIVGGFGIVHNLEIHEINISKSSQVADYDKIFTLTEPRDGDINIYNNRIKGSGSSFRSRLFWVDPRSGSSVNINIHDNFIWNIGGSDSVASSVFFVSVATTTPVYIYNNTIDGGYYTIYSTLDVSNWIFKNNILNQISGFGETVDATSDYNASVNTSVPGGSNDITSATIVFVDDTTGDLHLTSGATSVIGAGVGPSSDSNVATSDIDGNTRSGTTVDIGADESVSVTYTVTYDGNGSDGGSVPIDGNSPYDADATVAVLGNTGSLTNAGYILVCWNTAADGTGTNYAVNDTFAITAGTTLYALWKTEAELIEAYLTPAVAGGRTRRVKYYGGAI